MALIRDIAIGVSADTKELVSGLSRADLALGRFGKTVKTTGSGIGALTPLLAGLGTAAAAGAVAGLREAVGTAVQLETTLASLSKATDLEGAGLERMKDQIFRLSTEIKGVSVENLLDIAISGAKLGIATGDLVEYTRGIAMLSTAIDDIPAGEIADSVGKINTVFKLGVKGALQLGSAIDKLADSGASSASGIIDVTSRVSGTAAAMKLGAGESMALAAALLDTNTGAEAAGGAIKKLLMKMQDVSLHGDFARTAGMSAKRFADTMDTKPIAAVEAFLEGLKKLSGADQLKALAAVKIKGTEGPGEIQKLAQQVEAVHRYVGLAAHEFATLDQITKSYNATAALTSAEWVTFKNQLTIIEDTLGSAFLPIIKAGLKGVSTQIGDLNANLKESVGAISAWGAVLSTAIESIDVKKLSMLSTVLGTIAKLSPLGAAWDVLVGGPPGMVPPKPKFAGAFPPVFDKAAADAGAREKAAAEQKAIDDEEEALSKAQIKEIERTIAALKLEAATFGMTADQVAMYKLSLAGADAQTLKFAKDTLASNAARKKEAELTKKGKALTEDVRTPMEQFDAKKKELDELLSKSKIDTTTHARATRAAREAAFGKDTGPKFAGAQEAGSAEAYSSQLRFAYGTPSNDEPMKEVAKTSKEGVGVSRQMLAVLNKIANKGVGQVTNSPVELFAL